jgi:hypothetical protein
MINGIACFAYFNKIWGVPRPNLPGLFFFVRAVRPAQCRRTNNKLLTSAAQTFDHPVGTGKQRCRASEARARGSQAGQASCASASDNHPFCSSVSFV